MRNPGLSPHDPLHGTFALALLRAAVGTTTHIRGWPEAKWWASAELFWDDFISDGDLEPEALRVNTCASICSRLEIEPDQEAAYTFLLGWHFPNRTPEWCGWDSPKGHGTTIIGNHYSKRFNDAWAATEYVATNLGELERRTLAFVNAIRISTLPDPVRDAAVSNLSTLVTQTCFRTQDGEFHAFEGCEDHKGSCFGNCTHVWNYETATQHLFPTLARSLRKAAFGYTQDEQGGMRFRQYLPDGIERFPFAAADGQMGQIIKAYLDLRLSGDTEWLRRIWPRVQKAISFAWIPGGWDANRDGVMENVQHNTYDVEFYGPNPLCGIYYLGALRAAEEMAKTLGDGDAAREYRGLFDYGSRWIDANLFNGEYYVQQVRSIPKNEIAAVTVSELGSDRSDDPEFQVGKGCLADQLMGQYQADLAGLGWLLDPAQIRTALATIYKYNCLPNLYHHDSLERIFVLNDEPAVVICSYPQGVRPKIAFPYHAEAWTGIEYVVGTQLICVGFVEWGVRCFENVRRRFDGERRNPWDEPECGHHYARAMSAWSGVIAVSGFDYHAAEGKLTARPRVSLTDFQSFWSTPSGWGIFTDQIQTDGRRFTLSVSEGSLRIRSITLTPRPSLRTLVTVGSQKIGSLFSTHPEGLTVRLSEEVTVIAGTGFSLLTS